MKALQTKGAKFHADTEIGSCWHPPVCLTYNKSETGCNFGNKCYFRHVEADEKPSKKSKEGSVKGSLQLGCVSQDCYPRKSFYMKKETWDQITS